ncbi:hypothetical protein LOD99_12868 [Oopsacas minuta]|uniref:Uncharacterized protein n=1 Tax=Oopsacas minuta TaxID=111878 RepID=A0AAV7JDJ0_9METZ|nr:hypothetical protein LOD99_12868 [Oopsacas minuta]
MGSSLSLKRRVEATTNDFTVIRPNSCDILSDSYPERRLDIPSKRQRNNSFDNILTYRKNPILISPKRDFGSCSSNDDDTYLDITENRFLKKVQLYLRSLEQLGDISNLKFHYGHLKMKTEDGEEVNMEVHDQDYDLGEPLIALKPETNENNFLFVYTYCSSAKALSSRYTNISMIYITDVHRSKSKYHILQAGMTPQGQPTFIPRKIRVPDNPKLTSPFSRFIGILQSGGLGRTMLLFLTSSMEPYYLAQSDMSLDFTKDDRRAVVLEFKPQYYE